jgi:acetyl esterase/lipase
MASLQSYILRTYLNYNKSKGTSLPPLEELRSMQEDAAKREQMPRGILRQTVSAGGVEAEWLHPQEAPKERVLLYLHGGAYVMGSCNTHRALTAHVARACGMRGLLLNYRLAPEYPFPAAVEDAVAAYRWLLNNSYKAGDIVIAGDSAGGGLALATLLSLRDAGDPLPAAAVCITPWTDLAGTGDSLKSRARSEPRVTLQFLSLGSHYVGDNDPCLPLISPMYADLRGLPPLLIRAGSDDMLLDDSTRVAERAKAAGVDVTLEVWDRMWHVFHLHVPRLPEARRAIDAIGAFVKQKLGEPGSVKSCALSENEPLPLDDNLTKGIRLSTEEPLAS